MTEISPETDAVSDWRAAVLEHEPWLRSLVAGRVGDPQTVDDLVQEVLLAAMELPPDGEPVREPQAWLRSVATRQVSLHYRTTERRERHENAARTADVDELSPLAIVLRAEHAGLVKQALAEIDPEAAELLRLKYVERCSYAEIGNRLGRSWNDIAHGLHNAKKALRKRLAAVLGEEHPLRKKP